MTHEESKALWAAVEGLRGAMVEVKTLLASVKALLGERCEARARVIEDFRVKLDKLEDDLWTVQEKLAARIAALEMGQIKVNIYVGIGSSVATAAVLAVVGTVARKVIE